MTYPEDGQSADLSAVLGADGNFDSAWLQGKSVAPVPVGAEIDAALARRIGAGCRAVGASHILCADLSLDAGVRIGRTCRLPAGTACAGIQPPCLLCTPDLQGAVLFPEAGHALIAGSADFMAAAVGEGVEAARARFGRYARTLSARHPALMTVAAAYPSKQRAWSSPADVDPASAAARQLALLDAFADGTRDAPDFAHGWWEARRASQANGERVRGPLSDLFDRVFMLLEDYSVDPDLREPGDLEDADLRAAVSETWHAFRHPGGDLGG